LGHVFSVFLKGRGGKGVATALGAGLALTPLPALAAFGVYVVFYLALRISSLGSLAGALSYTAFLFFLGKPHPAYFAFGGVAAAIIFVRHRDNLRRLAQGQELKAP
jgi:glycerol-3-phosphate acyltransferase PlsY